MSGYHVNTNHAIKLVTIHAPTNQWQHLPRETAPSAGFWIGPLESVEDAQDAAQEVGERHDYAVHRCRTCFYVPQERARVRRKRERRARSIWPTGTISKAVPLPWEL